MANESIIERRQRIWGPLFPQPMEETREIWGYQPSSSLSERLADLLRTEDKGKKERGERISVAGESLTNAERKAIADFLKDPGRVQKNAIPIKDLKF